jgi:hypothetical protein
VAQSMTDIAGIDEYQAAVIQGNCPTPTRIGNVNADNFHTASGVVSEILNYHPRLLVAVAGVDADPLAYSKLRRCGGVGHVILPGFGTGIHEYYVYNNASVKTVKTADSSA